MTTITNHEVMIDRPILFSGSMIRALLEGRKSQTRRVLKPQPVEDFKSCTWNGAGWSWLGASPRNSSGRVGVPLICPGYRLWVREHWRSASAYDDLSPSEMGGEEPVIFEADGATVTHGWSSPREAGRHRQGMHMPRWASRLTLIVTDVRVQRVQDISEADARSEGCPAQTEDDLAGMESSGWFRDLWNSLNAKRGFGWDANPWVSATTFTVHRCNIDQMETPAHD